MSAAVDMRYKVEKSYLRCVSKTVARLSVSMLSKGVQTNKYFSGLKPVKAFRANVLC